MFYDSNVMNSETLGVAWRLANHMPADTSNVDLIKISSSVKKCLESGQVSLRTSSALVYGTARAYKKETNKLYTEISDSIQLRNQMLQHTNRPSIKIATHKKNSTKKDSRSKIVKKVRKNETVSRKGNTLTGNIEILIPQKSSGHANRCTNSVENSSSHKNKINASKRTSRTTVERAVQTTKSFISDKRKKYSPNNSNIDETQSYGLMMVFDEGSQIPRKIIYSKINAQVL